MKAIEAKSLEVLERLEDHEIATGRILFSIPLLFDLVWFTFFAIQE
jgi:hypothetical protein